MSDHLVGEGLNPERISVLAEGFASDGNAFIGEIWQGIMDRIVAAGGMTPEAFASLLHNEVQKLAYDLTLLEDTARLDFLRSVLVTSCLSAVQVSSTPAAYREANNAYFSAQERDTESEDV